MFYSLVYIFMKGGSFIALNSVNHESVELADVSGLAKKSPALAVSFAILLLALAGIPLTGGFFAKYLLFLSLIEGGLWWLAVIAILNSAISVFYYFRVIMYMFGRNPVGDQEFDLTRSVKVPVYASATITVVLSLMILWFPAVINIASGLFG
jgi:NADH-quinone oxidoreductase subunit N